MMKRFIACTLMLGGLFTGLHANAEYPERPIRIIVPFAGGGGIDTAARNFAKGLSQALDATIIVENKPGANSIIGANEVAKSKPDGYTLLFTSGSTVAVLPHISESLPFNPGKDFVAVGKIAKLPFYLVVHPSVPAKTLPEFIDQAKAAPGKFTYASAGSGTGAHLGFELLKDAAKIDITHVPYKATREALPDLLTGRVASMMADPSTVRSPVASGALRVLAISTIDRSPEYPNVPTVAEESVPGFDLELWFGVFAPAGTPPEVISKINKGMHTFLKSPEGSNAFDNVGFTVDVSSPESLTQLVSKESKRWEALAKTGALKIE